MPSGTAIDECNPENIDWYDRYEDMPSCLKIYMDHLPYKAVYDRINERGQNDTCYWIRVYASIDDCRKIDTIEGDVVAPYEGMIAITDEDGVRYNISACCDKITILEMKPTQCK